LHINPEKQKEDIAMLKMGIIGMGKMGEFHAGWMTPQNQLQLVAVCEKSEKRIADLKKKYPQLHYYTDVDEFLKKEDIDFAVVVTTHETHEELVVKVLNAGKNVIVEKPMSMTYESTQQRRRIKSICSFIRAAVGTVIFCCSSR
jgi:predicted dehydrogenase